MEGCERLVEPRPFDVSGIDVQDSGCPTVLVLEKMASIGWTPGRDQALRHTPDEPIGSRMQFFTQRNKFRKPYYQCVLNLQLLFDSGVTALVIGQPLSYYECLRALPEKALILPNLGDKRYKAMLKEGKVSDDALPLADASALGVALEDGSSSDAIINDEDVMSGLPDVSDDPDIDVADLAEEVVLQQRILALSSPGPNCLHLPPPTSSRQTLIIEPRFGPAA